MFNRNIIQPLPYLMYVLKSGFKLAQLELKGDIVEDPLLKKILIYAEKDPFIQHNIDPLILQYTSDDIDENTFTYEIPESWTGIPIKQYIPMKSILIDRPGKYTIIGQIDIRTNNYNYKAQFNLYKDNEVIFTRDVKFVPWQSLIEVSFILPSGTCEIRMEAFTAIGEYHTVADLQILPVYFINSQGKKEPNLLNENRVDLNKVVPNVTFGTLVNSVLNMFNYDVDSVTNTEIVINKIDTSIAKNEIVDLTSFENTNVRRKSNTDTSYLLKYDQEGDLDLGGFYIDKTESKFVTKEFNKKPQTEISIPIYPLQNELINEVFTAKSIQSSEDKICFVLYDGLLNGQNYSLEPSALAIPNLVNSYHYTWLNNRVRCIPYDISFIAEIEDVIDLNTKKRAYCYNNIHLIKSISKNQLLNGKFEIEIETETLEN